MPDSEETGVQDNSPEVGEETPATDTPAKKKRKPSVKKKKATKKVSKKRKSAKKSTGKEFGVRKPRPDVPRGKGIIATILATTQRKSGATAQEIFEVLSGKFPGRGQSLLTTTRIQVSTLPKRLKFKMRKERVKGRGLVYYAPASIEYPVAA